MSDDKQIPENEPKFNYIEEKVMPKRKKRIKRFIFSLFNTLILAVVFGLTARYIFIMSEPYFNKILGIQEEEVFRFPSASPTVEITPSPTPSPTATPIPTPTPLEEEPVDNSNKDDDKDNDKDDGDKVNQVQVIENYISPTVEDYIMMYQDIMKNVNETMYSIVTITAIESGLDYLNESFEKRNSTSGVVITINKFNIFIIASYSEVKGASMLNVEFYGGIKVDAGIYNYDPDYDIVILAINVKDLDEDILMNIKQASLDDSYLFQAGLPVALVSNLNGNIGSVDIGIISKKAISKNILDDKLEIYQTNLTYYAESEGFVLNLKGEVMGFISHKHKENEDDEITTFVAINRLKPVIEKLISKEDLIYFGVVAEDIPQEVLKERDIEYGVFVTDVRTGSPAFQAGIRIGDIITNIGSYNILSVSTFVNCLSYYPSGEAVVVLLKRSSTKQSYKDMELIVTMSSKVK